MSLRKKSSLYFLYVWVLGLHVYTYAMYVPAESRGGHGSPGTEVTDNCDPPGVDVGPCLQPQKTELLINTCMRMHVYTWHWTQSLLHARRASSVLSCVLSHESMSWVTSRLWCPSYDPFAEGSITLLWNRPPRPLASLCYFCFRGDEIVIS